MASYPQPPLVPARPHEVVTPNGSKRNDPYAWLRDDDGRNSEVIKYLRAENDYGKGILSVNAKLEERLLYEMDSRVPRVETSPHAPSGSLSYWYGSSRGPGQDYWVHTRRPALTRLPQGDKGQAGLLSYGPNLKVPEQVVLDINTLAEGFRYCDVATVKPSPDGRYVAFTVDTVGNEEYELVVQEIGTGRRVPFAGTGEESSEPLGSEGSGAGPGGGLGGLRRCGGSVEWSADSSAVFALLLTPRTREAYKLIRCPLLLTNATTTMTKAMRGLAGGSGTAIFPKAEVLLQDDKSGAVLELAGRTSCGRFMMVYRKAEGYTTLLALTLPADGGRGGRRAGTSTGGGGDSGAVAQQPTRGIPDGVKLFGTDPWVVIAPESDACDVLRADHLYGDGDGKETFAVLMDTDRYPDGCICAVMGGDLKRRTVLIPGQRGRQLVDLAVRVECESNSSAAAVAITNGTKTTCSPSDGIASAAPAKAGHYLVVHMLEDMKASVQVYNISSLKQALATRDAARVAARGGDRGKRRQQQPALKARAAAEAAGKDGATAAAAAATVVHEHKRKGADEHGDDEDKSESDDTETESEDADADEVEQGQQQQQQSEQGQRQQPRHSVVQQARAAAPRSRNFKKAPPAAAAAGRPPMLPLLWSYSPGDAISSLHLDHGCWPGTLPYVRLSYSNLTTPTTTVDLDLAAQLSYKREVERVEHYTEGVYVSSTLWVTSEDGTRVPATLACRTDAWPPATGRPLPCILQAYGAYGRKLLPDFIPGDLAILDGGGTAATATAAAAAAAAELPPPGCGPVLMVLAHVRGGGELGSYWHVAGKKRKKDNTAADVAAVVRALVQAGYIRREAVALWGRSAGGLAMGMTLERFPPGTFRAAVLDVPFLDVLGAMSDPSLPLTLKERPEWGDPATYQEDYDYILSYSPYDNVERVAIQTPALMVTCSLKDPRVPYWGPAKFVARLRAAMAAAAAGAGAGGAAAVSGPVVLLTELQAGGHFSASGASGRLAERAMRVAFMMAELRRGMAAAAAPTATATVQPAKRREVGGGEKPYT